ncbi:MAG: 50S ribosomal protein L32 [Patescibacteria group bacterium]
MALPGHRRTSSHKRRRAAHFGLKKTNLSVCPKCKKSVMSHHVCKSCGTYAGKEVIKMRAPKKKKK